MAVVGAASNERDEHRVTPPSGSARRLLLVCGSLLSVAWFLRVAFALGAPVSWDEGYDLQVPVNLIKHGEYASDGAIYEIDLFRFDVRVTTGPTVLLPIAAVFKVVGPELWAARGVMVIFFALLTLATWMLASHSGGPWAGHASVAALLAIDSSVDWPRSVLTGPADAIGEYPAAALLMMAALFVGAKKLLAGTFLGLALLAKVVVLLAVPAFFLLVLVRASGLKGKLADCSKMFAGLCLPLTLWNTYKFIELGPSLFVRRIEEFMTFMALSGSGIPVEDVSVLKPDFPVSQLIAAVGLPLIGVIVVALLSLIRAQKSPSSLLWRSDVGLLIAFLAIAFWIVWWVGLSDTWFIRHLLIALLLLPPLIGVLAVTAARITRSRYICAALALGLGVAATSSTADRNGMTGLNPELQAAAAEIVRISGADAIVVRPDPWQVPDIRFLSGVRATPMPSGKTLIVADPTEKTHAPKHYQETVAACDEVIFARGDYVVCWPRVTNPFLDDIPPVPAIG